MKSIATIRIPILFLGLLISGINLFAQKTMFLGSDNNATVGTTFSIPVMVKNFTNVVAFQGSVNWNHSALTFAGVNYSTAYTMSKISLQDTSLGRFGFIWVDPNSSGVSIPDSTVVLTFKFNVAPGYIGTTPIVFGSLPSPLEIDTVDQITFIPAPNWDTSFIAGYARVPVTTPLKLLSFIGNNSEQQNQLNWTSTNEENLLTFVIERSGNGITFKELNTIKAIGNKHSAESYIYTDNTSLFTAFYRLRMIENNGSFTYSPIIKINKNNKSIFHIQTNPIQNGIIKVYGTNMKEASVFDYSERLLQSQSLSNEQQNHIKISNFIKGTYLLKIVSTEGFIQTEKFIVE